MEDVGTKRSHEPIPLEVEKVATRVLDAAFAVHRSLGPGLLELVYERCLCHELSKQGTSFRTQVTMPVIYDGVRIDSGLRLDLFVEEVVVVELKAVAHLESIHEAQLFTYLKLTNTRLGLLINFNVQLLKEGIKRVVR